MLKLSVLAVDDSPVITEMIKDAFEAEGYKILAARDGVEALRLALEAHPDIIIADVNMPGMDGWELCSQIRKNPFTSFIPFIFLTSKTESPDRIKGLRMGADDYLTKPFEMAELLARVQLIFQRMRKNQEAVLLRGQQKTLSGSTSEMGLPDLLQLFGLNQKTGLLRISKVGYLTGKIAVENGKIVRAELGPFRGEKAIYRLLKMQDANFDVAPLNDGAPDPGFPSSVDEILMEGMRQMDELARLEKEYPLTGRRLSVFAPSASELSPREAELLAAVEKKEAIGDVLDALPWTDFEIYRMVVYFIRKEVIKAE